MPATEAISIHRVSAADSLAEVGADWPDGLYTVFRTLAGGGKVVGLEQHLARLYQPSARLGIVPRLTPLALRRQLAQALSALSAGEEARVRLHLAADGRFFVAWQPFRPLPWSWYRHGVKVCTCSLHREEPSIKRSAFIRQRQAALTAVQAFGAYEGLMVHRGRILEGLTSNFFYVKNGVLCTAARGVLPGVTRASVLRLARAMGLPRCYRALRVQEVGAIEEAFLCSSSRALLPIVQIDEQPVGNMRPGKLTWRLLRAYCQQQEALAEPILPL